MNLDFSEFHFIRPLWLALLLLLPMLWYFARNTLNSSGWERYLPPQTIKALTMNSPQNSPRRQRWWLAGLLALIIAGAGPTWVKQPVPVLQNLHAMVILLDLSPSMLADDLKPDRLTRAKFKLIDILRKRRDGQIALIAYAGDAHTVSPLTDDPVTIEALLPALHPNIMPSSGSNTEAAIELAQELLRNAGVGSGEILLITDGIAANAIGNVRDRLSATNTLSILGVGGREAVPVPSSNGGFLRNSQGEIVLAGLNSTELSELATDSGGRFIALRSDEADIDYLLQQGLPLAGMASAESTTSSYDSWADMGHWLVLLVLPLVALCFRRGLIYLIPMAILLPFDAGAATPDGPSWMDLWLTRDQQAARLLQQQDYTAAAEKFQREDWSGIANYRSGDYAQAVKQFNLANNSSDIEGLYNKGNALAFTGSLQAAIDAYDQVLTQQPDHADAAHNKKVLEQLMQQQNQQQAQSENSDEQNSDEQQEQGQEQGQEQSSTEQSSQQGDQPAADNGNDNPQSTDAQQSSADNKQQGPTDQQAADKSSDQMDGEADRGEEQAGDQQQKESIAENDPSRKSSETEADKTAESANPGEPGDNEQIGTALQDSSEQWLRSIQDDPSGLLRRKFEYQSWQNAQRPVTTNQSADDPQDRY